MTEETGFINFADGLSVVWMYTGEGDFGYALCTDVIDDTDDPIYQAAIAGLAAGK